MKWFKNLSPTQRQMLLIGVPVVAVFALVMALRGGSPDEDLEEESATSGTPARGFVPSGGGDAIGAGQLASYEDAVTSELDVLHQQIEKNRASQREAIQAQQDAYDQFLDDVAGAGSGSQLPAGGFQIDDPPEKIGIYTIDNELVRVGGDPAGGDENVRAISEYGAAGGRQGIIDTVADQRFVERARGVQQDDPQTARLILQGSFGPVAQAFKPRLRQIANNN